MDPAKPNFFAGPYLDRRAEAREDPEWIAAAWADTASVYMLARGTAQLVTGDPPRAALLTRELPLVRSAPAASLTLLGWFHGARCVLITLPREREIEPPAGTRFEELRPLSALLPADEAGLLAYARALSVWRTRTHHCGVCGAPTAPTRGGHCLTCTNSGCAEEFFPRIDPAIIVLVTDGERALLGRQASWPPRRYSTIAGFVEPGESLEDAVAREVEEETGVTIDQRALRLLAALAVPVLAHARLPGARCPGKCGACRRRARGRALVHARTAQLGRGARTTLALDLLAPDLRLARGRVGAHVSAGARLGCAPALSTGGGRQPR